jgi:chromosome segregation ATPase
MATKTQRPRPASTKRGQSSASQVTVAGKLKDVTGKMLEIQKEEETQLVALLKEVEAITRNTTNIENEIRRQNLLKGTLEAEQKALQKELQEIERQNRADDNKRKATEKERQKLFDQNTEMMSQLASLESDVKRLQEQNSSLSVDIEKLRATNGKLKADVERLTALREEYLKSIAEFKEMRDELLP